MTHLSAKAFIRALQNQIKATESANIYKPPTRRQHPFRRPNLISNPPPSDCIEPVYIKPISSLSPMTALIPSGPPAVVSHPATLVQPTYASPYDSTAGLGYGYTGYGYGSPRLYYPRRRSRWNRAAEAYVLGDEADRLRLLEAESALRTGVYSGGYGYGSYGAYSPYTSPYAGYYGGYGGYGGLGGYGRYRGYGGYPYSSRYGLDDYDYGY